MPEFLTGDHEEMFDERKNISINDVTACETIEKAIQLGRFKYLLHTRERLEREA